MSFYAVDTGVFAEHVEFDDRVVEGYSGVSDGRGTEDCHGHGTHTAGTVAGSSVGVAPGVTVIPVRVYGCSGTGWTSALVAGIRWAIDHHQSGVPAVMNISSSGPLSNQLNWAVRDAFLDGIVVVVAAGNNGKDACAYSPGATPEAITVGATEADDTLLHNSNFGPCVDVFAPGAWISSAAHTGPSDYRSFKGTSFAAPHVTGIAALILEANPTYTPQQVTDRIVADATSNTIRSLEASSPNLLAYAVPSIEVESTETTTTLPSTPVPPTVPTRATSDASTSSGSGHSGPATTTTTSTTAPASIIAAPLATPTPPPKFLTKRCKPEARRVVGTVIYRCTAKAKWIRVAANRMSRATSR